VILVQTQVIEAITSGLHGKWTHIDPKKALAGLTPANAKKKSNGIDHSCWELLHHTVFFLEVIINQIKGQAPNWHELESSENSENWPSVESMQDDSNYHKLVDRFQAGIEDAQNLLEQADFAKMPAGKPELSTIKLFLVLLQHTSYHIGQIITIRKCLGTWPPE
jgi:uncharacterized damage-inducible protein DinB